jgi:hypothetical protein
MKMKLESLRYGAILFEVFLRLASFLNLTSSRRGNCHRLQMRSEAAFYKVHSDRERTDSLFDQIVSAFDQIPDRLVSADRFVKLYDLSQPWRAVWERPWNMP